MAAEFRTRPDRYRHWQVEVDGPVATLRLAVDEGGGIAPGYELKLNSYDLGVDVELNDAVQRLRFEHPEVGAVVITSGRDRVFSAGANIRMLGRSGHADKVNFCKFTNETRNAIEDACAHSGQRYVAALNGAAAGGGYELALACDWIVLVDDGSSAVSLPEVPLLGVLPRDRRPHPGRGQAQGAPRPRRLLLHGGGRGCAGGGRSTGASWTSWPRGPGSRRRCASGRGRSRRTSRPREGSPGRTSSARPGRRGGGTAASRWRSTAPPARPRSPCSGRSGTRPPIRPGSTRRARASGRSSPASWTTRSCSSGTTSWRSAPGCSARGATSRGCSPSTASSTPIANTGSCARFVCSGSGS